MRSLRQAECSAEPTQRRKPSAKGEALMKQFLILRDEIFNSDATDEQKKTIWSEFLKVYTGVF